MLNELQRGRWLEVSPNTNSHFSRRRLFVSVKKLYKSGALSSHLLREIHHYFESLNDLIKIMKITILVFSHGWSCRSSAAQTVEFPELMHLKLQPGALGRPSRKSRLTEPLPYLGLGNADLIRACQSVTRVRRFNFDPRKNPPRRVLVLILLR
jgi:hypothetical protein